MKKKIFSFVMMALTASWMTMSVSSCKDDDNDNESEQRNEDADPMDTEQAQTAWRWLCTMTDAQNMDDNWQSKNYEPTIGQPSDNNKLARVVVVRDFNEAAQQFASIADVEVSKLSQEQKFSQSGVGSLTWTPSKAGAQNLAEVAVDIKNIPNLQKLVYCTADQVGENGIFWDNVQGTAYYRFGDVVRDKDGYYWVCVRPSFAPDKGDSHWINVFNASEAGGNRNIPSENLYTKYSNKQKYNNQTIILPTKLTYNREHLYNLSNLLWAMLKPEDYKSMTSQGKGLGGFDYTYNGYNFVNRVANFWKQVQVNGRSLWEVIFNRTYDQMKEVNVANFFYKGYSWTWGQTGNLWNYRSGSYQNGIAGSESADKVEYNFVTGGFNANYLAGASGAVERPEGINNNGNGNWIVRYKRGDKLWGAGSYSPYSKFPECEDIYRYNDKTGKLVQTDLETENQAETIPASAAAVGNIIGEDGKIYATMEQVAQAKTTAAAVVCYVNPGGNAVETGQVYHGLAIALMDITANTWTAEEINQICTDNCTSNDSLALTYMNGLAVTEALKSCKKGTKVHSHPFAGCVDLGTATIKDTNTNHISKWFIPSAGQMALVLDGMGFKWIRDQYGILTFVPKKQGDNPTLLIKQFFDYGKKGNIFEGVTSEESISYWLSSEASSTSAWMLTFAPSSNEADLGLNLNESDKAGETFYSRVRPVVAFGSNGVFSNK